MNAQFKATPKSHTLQYLSMNAQFIVTPKSHTSQYLSMKVTSVEFIPNLVLPNLCKFTPEALLRESNVNLQYLC